jgi:hypothetical protein
MSAKRSSSSQWWHGKVQGLRYEQLFAINGQYFISMINFTQNSNILSEIHHVSAKRSSSSRWWYVIGQGLLMVSTALCYK